MTQLNNAIAVVGIACRFPGANDPLTFWSNLRQGVDSISNFSDEELESAGTTRAEYTRKNFVRSAGVLDQVTDFDAEFFGFSRREVEILDPQHRLFMEVCWEALESAGVVPSQSSSRIGIFAGASMSHYLFFNLLPRLQNVDGAGMFQAMIFNDKDYMATRTAYKLNLTGPAICVQTACSTSLVATHLACQSLLSGESDFAIAGGASLNIPQRSGYIYQDGGVLSPDGRCRAFDARSHGTASGSGVGVVLLQRLEDAIAEQTPVWSVIRASAVNNDGSLKVGYTAPSVDGQASVIAEAMAMAEVEPESIGYVEAHGTGTPLGDPVELTALTQAYRQKTSRRGYCAIGSLKTNVGHMDSAAGVGGLIKASLSLYHREIPPSLNFETPNPQIDFESSPFFVNTKLRTWESSSPRRAGVSSFGIGGTNAHLILEEAPPEAVAPGHRKGFFFPISAKSEAAVNGMAEKLAAQTPAYGSERPVDIAYTLLRGRTAFSHRKFVVAEDIRSLGEALKNVARTSASVVSGTAPAPVIFLFPGQGAQYPEMAKGLYETHAVFRETLDRCAEIVSGWIGLDFRSLLFPKPDLLPEAAEALRQTEITQPVLFSVEYAMAKLWQHWGVEPVAMIGHSLGEYVAACVAESLSLEDSLKFISARGRCIQEHALPGSMFSAAISPTALPNWLEKFPGTAIAAVNAPQSCVIAGATEAVMGLREALTETGVSTQALHTSHAFHSPRVEPAMNPFRKALSEVTFRAPKIPYVSNLTGEWVAAAQDAEYWVQHMQHPVLFAAGLSTIFAKHPHAVLLEVGPGRTLSTLAARCSGDTKRVMAASLRHPQENASDDSVFLRALGTLWASGVPFRESALFEGENAKRIRLPTYAWQRQKYWVEAPDIAARQSAPASSLTEVVGETAVLPSRSEPVVVPEGEDPIAFRVQHTWKEFLGTENLHAETNYFEAGGDSLVASRIVVRLKEEFPVDLSVREFLEAQTVAKLTDLITQRLMEKLDGLSDEEAEALLNGGTT